MAEQEETVPAGQAPVDEELSKCRQERDELFARLARLTAEYQNSRRRLEADMEQRLQFANASLIKALIPVIDNFERALAVDPAATDAASLLKGLQLVHDQWLAVLKKENVQTIAPEPGTPFDPTQHEALIHQPSDQYDEPTVTQLLTKGYALHGRTLRPASVAVSQ
jgi:molecular chaperone GrpE